VDLSQRWKHYVTLGAADRGGVMIAGGDPELRYHLAEAIAGKRQQRDPACAFMMLDGTLPFEAYPYGTTVFVDESYVFALDHQAQLALAHQIAACGLKVITSSASRDSLHHALSTGVVLAQLFYRLSVRTIDLSTAS
jgi:hypothetical protein